MTHCNGNGECVANSTNCKGYCPPSTSSAPWGAEPCSIDLFPIAPYFLQSIIGQDRLIGYSNFCFASQCVVTTLQVMYESGVDVDTGVYDSWAAGEGMSCSEMLDTTTAVDTRCIKATEVLIDSNAVQAVTTFSFGGPVNYTARVCVFQYVCNHVNTTAFTDPAFLNAVVTEAIVSDPSTHTLRRSMLGTTDLHKYAILKTLYPSLDTTTKQHLNSRRRVV